MGPPPITITSYTLSSLKARGKGGLHLLFYFLVEYAVFKLCSLAYQCPSLSNPFSSFNDIEPADYFSPLSRRNCPNIPFAECSCSLMYALPSGFSILLI